MAPTHTNQARQLGDFTSKPFHHKQRQHWELTYLEIGELTSEFLQYQYLINKLVIQPTAVYLFHRTNFLKVCPGWGANQRIFSLHIFCHTLSLRRSSFPEWSHTQSSFKKLNNSK
jgi:hypothetical protein